MNFLIFAVALGIAPSQAAPTNAPYFPPTFRASTVPCSDAGKVMPTEILTDLQEKWYSAQLTAAREPSLYKASTHWSVGSGTVVRFTWLRSFHAPVFVRVEGLGTSKPRLVAKQLSGHGGYAPGSISKSLDRTLSPGEAHDIHLVLARSDIAHMQPRTCDIGVDGAQWIMESVDAHGYHFVDRQSPNAGGERDLALSLLRLTGWEVKPIY
ncbi:MAG: hypothetical protein ABR588_04770 [Sphingomicrobium sp.]|nr:hypothetical protein [Sphingomonadales bacterium]